MEQSTFNISFIKAVTQQIRREVGRVIVGQERALDLLLTALFAGGHVLLEDVPGVGKTMLSKVFAASIGCRFRRIQCTPDLLPSDVVGTTIYYQKTGEFTFSEGPLFSQIVLVDEINRAVPRTQSAFLEAMAEGQITTDGTTRSLGRPFFVIATQNPIESQGTFPLPEAQLDRFLMKLSLGYPTEGEERNILRHSRHPQVIEEVETVVTPEDIVEVQDAIRHIHLTDDVERYLLTIVRQTRMQEGVALGVSPRGTIALGVAAQALAGIRGRNYVIPDDIKFLAPHVLAHRLLLDASLRLKQRTNAELIDQIVENIAVPVEDDVSKGDVR